MKTQQTFDVVILPTLGKTSNIGFIRDIYCFNEKYIFDENDAAHIYFLSNDIDDLKEGNIVEFEGKILTVTTFDKQLDKNIVYAHFENGNGIGVHKDNFKKVVASSDKELTPNSWIPNSFCKIFIDDVNNKKLIGKVSLELKGVFALGNHWDVKTREDGSVIVHQAKMYSQAEMEEIVNKAWHNGYWSSYEEINGKGSSQENPISVLGFIKQYLKI